MQRRARVHGFVTPWCDALARVVGCMMNARGVVAVLAHDGEMRGGTCTVRACVRACTLVSGARHAARCFLVFWCVVKIWVQNGVMRGDRAKIRDALHTDFWCVGKIGWHAARCHLARGAIAHRWVSRGAVRVCDDIALGAIHSSDVVWRYVRSPGTNEITAWRYCPTVMAVTAEIRKKSVICSNYW